MLTSHKKRWVLRKIVNRRFHLLEREKKAKLVAMIEEDIALLKDMPRALPHLPFFRQVKGVSGVRPGQPFGTKYFYKIWIKACRNLGIEGVDLYGGTRHSTVTPLRKVATPEEIMGDGTEHSTNKAFMRYFQIKADKKRAISARARSAHHLHKENEREGKGKLLKFDK